VRPTREQAWDTLTRYIAMSIGVAIIFAGVLQTRRPEPAAETGSVPPAEPVSAKTAIAPNGKPRLVALPVAKEAPAYHDQALKFIETKLLPLPTEELSRECAAWSAARQETDTLTRDQARIAWQLRTRLTPHGQAAFDLLPPAIKLQLAELYTEVLANPEKVAQSG
jgi:hypothetical protein